MKGAMAIFACALLVLAAVDYAANTSRGTATSGRSGTSSNTWMTCTDADGGKSLTQKGTGTGCNNNLNPKCGTFTDTCDESLANKAVIEVYCEDNTIWWESYPCAAGSVCGDGRCVACTESDAGAYMYDAGITSGVSKATNYHQQKGDFCKNNVTVHEYFCKDGYMDETDLPCNYGYSCINGACVKTGPTCASEGQACPSGVVCCSGLSCTKNGTGYFCKSSTATKAVQAANSGTKVPFKVKTASGKTKNLTQLSAGTYTGILTMTGVWELYLTKNYSPSAKPYVLTFNMDKDGMAMVFGDLYSDGVGINWVDVLYDNPVEALAVYSELMKKDPDTILVFKTEDCKSSGDMYNRLSCVVGNGKSDSFQFIHLP